MKQETKFKDTEIGVIPEDWEVIDFSTVSQFKYGKMPQKTDITDMGYPIFSGYKIVGHHKNFMYEDSKLIIVARGVGGTGDVKLAPPKSYITNLSIIANLNEQVVSKYFLKYYFYKGLRYLDSGSAQSQITISDLNLLKIACPPLFEQTSIAKILSDLDSKIELLQKQNETLEAIGQALFKHWFVDFEFPNEEGKPYKSSGGEMVFYEELGKEIPKGWEVGKLGDILSELESGSRPKGGISDTDTDVPSIGAENILGLGKYNYSSTKYVSEKFYQKMKAGKVKDGDVLLYKDGAKLGRKSMFMCGFPFKKCCINEHVFILRNNNRLNQPFLFFWLDQKWVTKEIRNLNANSAKPGINKTTVSSLKVLIPEINILNNYYELQSPLLIKLFKNSLNIQTISKTRDLLLPKLMSGKIRVPVEVE